MLIQNKLSKKIPIISLLTGFPVVLTFIISFVQGLMIRCVERHDVRQLTTHVGAIVLIN